MAERTHIPSSSECGEWETLLADALDGLLTSEDEEKFAAHKAVCPACAALYDEARKGRQWLEFLSPEPIVPAGLLEKILATTGPGRQTHTGWSGIPTGNALPVPAGAVVVPSFVPPVWQQPGFFSRMRAAVQPRLMMTAAMAFFSIAVTLHITGFQFPNVRVTPLRVSDLRPRAMRAYMERQLTTASVPIVRYYDHLRLVYELESRVRELRDVTESEEQRNQDQPQKPGETRQVPNGINGDLRVTPQQSADGGATGREINRGNDLLESSMQLYSGTTAPDHAALHPCERGEVWIA